MIPYLIVFSIIRIKLCLLNTLILCDIFIWPLCRYWLICHECDPLIGNKVYSTILFYSSYIHRVVVCTTVKRLCHAQNFQELIWLCDTTTKVNFCKHVFSCLQRIWSIKTLWYPKISSICWHLNIKFMFVCYMTRQIQCVKI